MQLTTHTDYSLRLLIYLAISPDQKPATVQEAARRYGISANHLAKVAQTLVQLGLIQSVRGRGGGLRLSRAAGSINVGSVIRATENLVLLECFGPDSACPIDPDCRLKGILARAQQAFLDVLDGFTLADLVSNRSSLRHLLEIT